MRILYASAIETNAGWGAEVFLNAALLRNGQETCPVDYRLHRDRLSERLSTVGDFDTFLLQRGDHFPLPVVRAIQRPRFFYFSELVARRRDADHLFASNLFDGYFVRGPQCKAEVAGRGWVPEEKLHILLSAFDPETYAPLRVPKRTDVLFVGSVTPRRAALLERLSGRFAVEVHPAFGAQAAALYNRAKVVLNLHAEAHLDTETRVFEVLGTKSLLITEKLSPESPFRPGVHLVEAEDEEELVDQIAHYLKRPEEGERIAAQGYEEALARHTYEARARQIAEVMARALGDEAWPVPAIDRRTLRGYGRSESLQRWKRRLPGLTPAALRRARGSGGR